MSVQTHAGRVAVITGAARGIGQATCRRLAARGANIIGIDVSDLCETSTAVADTGRDWLGITCDVSDAEAVRAAADTVKSACGHIDILVNNAGIFPSIMFEDMTFADWRHILSVNLDSQFLMCHEFLPLMKQHGWGRIVNLTSNSVELSTPGGVAYKASKLGIVGLTRGLAADAAKWGITVNAVSPSLTHTPGVVETGAAAALPGITERQAIKRTAEPDDVVGAILFLTGEDSGFVTGQTLYADGGLAFR